MTRLFTRNVRRSLGKTWEMLMDENTLGAALNTLLGQLPLTDRAASKSD